MRVRRNNGNSRFPFATLGNRFATASLTGTLPVASIVLSSSFCSSSASSSFNSSSSIGSPTEVLVMALAISSPRACCSRSSSLRTDKLARIFRERLHFLNA